MRHATLAVLLAAAMTSIAAPTDAEDAARQASEAATLPQRALEPGAYEVTASLELPNIDDLDVRTRKTLCLVESGGAANHGFMVMSENNPLAGCPMVNVREAGDALTFDIRCTGSNSAKASATYTLMGDRFRGRIAMTMGGKNMTMTEVQEGRRLGACQPPS